MNLDDCNLSTDAQAIIDFVKETRAKKQSPQEDNRSLQEHKRSLLLVCKSPEAIAAIEAASTTEDLSHVASIELKILESQPSRENVGRSWDEFPLRRDFTFVSYQHCPRGHNGWD